MLPVRCHIVQKCHNVENVVKCIAVVVVALTSSLWPKKVSTRDQDSEIQKETTLCAKNSENCSKNCEIWSKPIFISFILLSNPALQEG